MLRQRETKAETKSFIALGLVHFGKMQWLTLKGLRAGATGLHRNAAR
jgi:hypothetical protein